MQVNCHSEERREERERGKSGRDDLSTVHKLLIDEKRAQQFAIDCKWKTSTPEGREWTIEKEQRERVSVQQLRYPLNSDVKWCK